MYRQHAHIYKLDVIKKILCMKKYLIILFILSEYISFSQDLPTEFSEGFSFPIGSKFTIKLDSKDPEKIKYSIIKFETFQQIIDSWKTNNLFEEKGEEGTIDFIFCIGTSGDNQKEKDKNMKVHLLFKNRTKLAMKYFSEIQTDEDGVFKKTSNIGTYPNAQGNEMWPYMIHAIGLRDFKIMN